MAISRTEICNRALLVLGESPIINTGETSKTAEACDIAYDPCLRILLEGGNWRFATGRRNLGGRVANSPIFQFENAYALPNDFLRLQSLWRAESVQVFDQNSYTIESGQLLTDLESPIHIIYTMMITDPRMFSEKFAEALVYRIALYTQSFLVESPTRQQYLEAKFEKVHQSALYHDSNNTSQSVGFYSPLRQSKF